MKHLITINFRSRIVNEGSVRWDDSIEGSSYITERFNPDDFSFENVRHWDNVCAEESDFDIDDFDDNGEYDENLDDIRVIIKAYEIEDDEDVDDILYRPDDYTPVLSKGYWASDIWFATYGNN